MSFVLRKSETFWVLLTILAIHLAGCGSGSDLEKVVVRGRVTLDGTAIPNGEIRFYPAGKTKGPPSGGPIKDGEYIAQGRGGVPAGTHRVEIRAFRTGRQSYSSAVAAEGGPAEQYLPAKYNTQSELTADIDATEQGSTKDFDLKSK
ncbi:MAG: hypothetical protein JW829_20625 [Pirellulales bacterium]|nr:hypothetical protein [Pirellulales bacterium]